MKKRVLFVAMLFSVLVVPSIVLAVPTWYTFNFTGVDIWTYSADNDSEARTDQDAPRRYRDWTQGAGNEVQATTYGDVGVLTNFNTWMATSGFAFDSINLWGAGGAEAWGEKYVSVGNSDPGAEGVSSWEVLQSPTGWSSGIVEGNDPWSADATHAFPVWRSAGDTDMLGLADKNDSNFGFMFRVLISNPDTAFEPEGTLRVFFGGFSDDDQLTGPGNYEVAGVMLLTPVPIPGAFWLFGSGLLGLVGIGRRRFNKM